jgi:pyrroloquinoline quinone biosynthesis protein B
MGWVDWVVGYRLTDLRTGGVVVYAPCLARWRPELATGADHVILDGTFLRADEIGAGQAVMGHLPVAESLPGLPTGPRYHYTHLNNTNPVADPAAPERELFDGTAASVAEDGQVIEI